MGDVVSCPEQSRPARRFGWLREDSSHLRPAVWPAVWCRGKWRRQAHPFSIMALLGVWWMTAQLACVVPPAVMFATEGWALLTGALALWGLLMGGLISVGEAWRWFRLVAPKDLLGRQRSCECWCSRNRCPGGLVGFDGVESLRPLKAISPMCDHLNRPVTAGVAVAELNLEHLRGLPEGWLDGEGLAPSEEGLDWLAAAWARHWPAHLRRPYAYPTVAGGVNLEWDTPAVSLSLEIDLQAKTAELQGVNISTGAVLEDLPRDLTDPASWSAFALAAGTFLAD